MSGFSAPQSAHAYEKFKEDASRFFETQLESIGLSRAQIEVQSITELEDSLVRIDDALRSPESFGVLRFSMTASTPVFAIKSNSEAHIEVGIVPLLLERKKAIVDRLRSLRSQRPIQTLADLVDSVTDHGLREQLRTELDATR